MTRGSQRPHLALSRRGRPGWHRGTPLRGGVPGQVAGAHVSYELQPAAAPGQTSRSEVATVIDLSGRVVIVTGATAASGSAVAELEALGATAIGVQCDVSDEDTVAGAMRATLAARLRDRRSVPRRPLAHLPHGDGTVVDGGYTIF